MCLHNKINWKHLYIKYNILYLPSSSSVGTPNISSWSYLVGVNALPRNSLSMLGTALSGGSIHSNNFWNKWYVNGAFPPFTFIILEQKIINWSQKIFGETPIMNFKLKKFTIFLLKYHIN